MSGQDSSYKSGREATKIASRTIEAYLPRYQPQPNSITSILGAEDEGTIQEYGITNLWFPVVEKLLPFEFSSGLCARIRDTQHSMLSSEFSVDPDAQGPTKHRHIAAHAIQTRYRLPIGLKYKGNLGRGAFGAVFKVECDRGHVYALKKIDRKENFSSEQKQMASIKSELDILRKIRHPHFVELVGSYSEPNAIGILMAPVAECNLEQFLERYPEDRSQAATLTSFFGCLATALTHLHYFEHIRHKDIKPSNILVKDNSVFLTDFGLSLDWSDAGRSTTANDDRKTWRYCAPEVARNEKRNASSDIWSLGCVFLEMAAVLLGKTMEDMQDLRDSKCYWDCETSINGLISELKAKNPRSRTPPLDWAESMLKQNADERPTSRKLRHVIQGAREAYFGGCCVFDTMHSDDSSETSSRPGTASTLSTTASELPDTVIIVHAKELRLVEVEIQHNPQSARNWISPDIVEHCKLHRLRLEKRERFVLEGQKLEASQFVNVPWVKTQAGKPLSLQIKENEFIVAPPKVPFTMLFGKDYNEHVDMAKKSL